MHPPSYRPPSAWFFSNVMSMLFPPTESYPHFPPAPASLPANSPSRARSFPVSHEQDIPATSWRRPGLVRRTQVRPVLLPFHRLTQCQVRAGWGQRPGSCRERPAQPSRSQLRVQKLRPLGPAAGARLVPRMLRLHIRLGPKCLTFQYLGFQSRSGPGSCYLFNAQAP